MIVRSRFKLRRSRFKPRYEDYQNMVKKLAWHYARHSDVDFHELESEGYLVFCQCANERPFDPAKSNGNFGGYLWTCLDLKFKSICFPLYRPHKIELMEHIPSQQTLEMRYFQFYSMVDSLSEDAQAVVSTILETPYKELETLYESQRKFFRNGNARVYKDGYSRTCLKNHFIKCAGWKEERVKSAFNEIRMSLGQLQI